MTITRLCDTHGIIYRIISCYEFLVLSPLPQIRSKIKPQQTTDSSDSSEAASFVQWREKGKQLHKAQSKNLSFDRVLLHIFPPLFQVYTSVGNNKIPLHS